MPWDPNKKPSWVSSPGHGQRYLFQGQCSVLHVCMSKYMYFTLEVFSRHFSTLWVLSWPSVFCSSWSVFAQPLTQSGLVCWELNCYNYGRDQIWEEGHGWSPEYFSDVGPKIKLRCLKRWVYNATISSTRALHVLLEHNMLQITIYLSNLDGVWSANN